MRVGALALSVVPRHDLPLPCRERGLQHGRRHGVDKIIVAAGSNTRMGDSNDTLFPGDSAFTEDYPFETSNADGVPLLIVNVDADYKYLGRLVVGFDANGVLLPATVDESESGAWASTAANVTLSGGTANANVVAVRDAVQAVITVQCENVIGHTDVFLDGRRESVRTQETNLGNLTADMPSTSRRLRRRKTDGSRT